MLSANVDNDLLCIITDTYNRPVYWHGNLFGIEFWNVVNMNKFIKGYCTCKKSCKSRASSTFYIATSLTIQ